MAQPEFDQDSLLDIPQDWFLLRKQSGRCFRIERREFEEGRPHDPAAIHWLRDGLTEWNGFKTYPYLRSTTCS